MPCLHPRSSTSLNFLENKKNKSSFSLQMKRKMSPMIDTRG